MIFSPLHEQSYSLNHEAFIKTLATTENLLIIQDLDGVCMGLVKDPLTRKISPDYIRATQQFDSHFFVLTNGEHEGRRGVNRIVEKAFSNGDQVSYLPGLAAGGVQWQTRNGEISHPGVTQAELTFLASVPMFIEQSLATFFEEHSDYFAESKRKMLVQAAVLDNLVSPTANLNVLAEHLQDNLDIYLQLQKAIAALMDDLLDKAKAQDLDNSFFVHYAPNLGRDDNGKEIVRFATASDSGTTDFQFMLRGAVKEAGVPVLLNHYYHQRTGSYPLGAEFNARQAPQENSALLQLIKDNFDPALMPLIIGVGDTITSQIELDTIRRGGSDRLFLQLIQDIGAWAKSSNLVTYIDSSQGELKNRIPLTLDEINGEMKVVTGVTDPADPLQINIAFPGGFQQYTAAFQEAANLRTQAKH
ncbi:glucosylglycerol 3-phosphatase [[Limnothrix rosea] IAM M-220]|uniref:glucosylglycerol 3-phosphatase n=1 Tax=[Limnothrix rosea] IAM M-220 TaxID=454133 RepID=UPI00095D95B4|nr:glucosylglycerol 3-phosphatase [[Limnothrix rosea] IAM M-220]OKH16016.1 glucosylglycerol 3-phosphatase [[Limnothrix rosea] IAM M-220]